MIHWITTTDTTRARTWERLFGSDRLPVKSPRPRCQSLGHGPEVLAYDLDPTRLPEGAMVRFSHYLARRLRIPFEEAQHLANGWPIKAAGCVIVVEETAEPESQTVRPLSFFGRSRGAGWIVA